MKRAELLAPILRGFFLLMSMLLAAADVMSMVLLPRPVSDVESFRSIAILATAALCFLASRSQHHE